MQSLLLLLAASASAQHLIPNIPRAPSHEVSVPAVFRRQQSKEPCAQVSARWTSQQNLTSTVYVPAQLAYDCLLSVPVDKEGDLVQISELKEHLQFQSNMNYLKNGIEHHNKPLDVMGSLDRIAQGVRNGSYKSEYEVQRSIQLLLSSAGDNHLSYTADIITPFTFVRPGAILVSLSQDGTSLPEVYYASDLAITRSNFTASPIRTINGKNVTQFLVEAATYDGYHDVDARYNRLFPNQALLSTGNNADDGGFFANPGGFVGQTTVLGFANGTTRTIQNLAAIGASFNFEDITDGRSFFDNFCTGPTDSEEAPTTNSTRPRTRLTPNLYPTPVIVQSSLAVQGYYLNGTGYDDVAVLAIPNFGPKLGPGTNETNPNKETQKVLRAFFADAVRRGKKKLVIDLRGNGGGTIDIGYEVFKNLFPDADPYGGTRYRSHPAFQYAVSTLSAVLINNTIKQTYPEVYEQVDLQGNTFYWENIRNANGTAFKSFNEYYGPYINNGDNFTAVFRYNYSNAYFGYTSADSFNVTGYLDQAPAPPQPFQRENIVILQDGYCSSTCSIFSELMREQGKVQTIAIGGRPTKSPMQGIGGTKGAQVFGMDLIVQIANQTLEAAQLLGPSIAQSLNNTVVGKLFATSQLAVRSSHLGDDTIAGSVNSLDNLRQNDSTGTPLEFIYEAADCRLFNTFASARDVTALWKLSVDAKWGSGRCAEGSTGDKTAVSVLNGETFNRKQGTNGTLYSSDAGKGVAGSMFGVTIAAVAVAALMI